MGTVSDLDTDNAPAESGSTQQANNDDSLDSNFRTKCSICFFIVGHKTFTCCCIGCGQSAHLSCLVIINKDSGAVASKNNLEWLQGFIQQSSLYYNCQRCSDSFNFSGKSIAHINKESHTGSSHTSFGIFTAEKQILHNEIINIKS